MHGVDSFGRNKRYPQRDLGGELLDLAFGVLLFSALWEVGGKVCEAISDSFKNRKKKKNKKNKKKGK